MHFIFNYKMFLMFGFNDWYRGTVVKVNIILIQKVLRGNLRIIKRQTFETSIDQFHCGVPLRNLKHEFSTFGRVSNVSSALSCNRMCSTLKIFC
jgi:hypothetical protein